MSCWLRSSRTKRCGLDLWHKLELPPTLPEGLLHAVMVDGLSLLVVRSKGEISVFDDRCTHERVPLSVGSVTSEGHIRCAMHHTEYDPISGLNIQEEFDPLHKYRIKTEADGTLLVEVTEEDHVRAQSREKHRSRSKLSQLRKLRDEF